MTADDTRTGNISSQVGRKQKTETDQVDGRTRIRTEERSRRGWIYWTADLQSSPELTPRCVHPELIKQMQSSSLIFIELPGRKDRVIVSSPALKYIASSSQQ